MTSHYDVMDASFVWSQTLLLSLPTSWLSPTGLTPANYTNHYANPSSGGVHDLLAAASSPGSATPPPVGKASPTSSRSLHVHASNHPIGFNVTLQYLTSWQQMGQLWVACAGACECGRHVIDGHATHEDRNVTVFTEYSFAASFQPSGGSHRAANSCALRLHVRNETSSGGHLFRVRDVIMFVAANPCKAFRHLGKFLVVRNGLACV